MSNSNNKQPVDLTESLPVATGGLTMEDRVGQVNARQYRGYEQESSGAKHPATGNKLGIPKIKKPAAPEISSQPGKKNDSSLDIPASSGICQVL
ncbi:hypothetical protein Tco_0871038 [Tanacetum coccineum]